VRTIALVAAAASLATGREEYELTRAQTIALTRSTAASTSGVSAETLVGSPLQIQGVG
jgi:hypothetical protein